MRCRRSWPCPTRARASGSFCSPSRRARPGPIFGLRQSKACVRSDDPVRGVGARQAPRARQRQGRRDGGGQARGGAPRRQAGTDGARERMTRGAAAWPPLPPRLKPILEAEYPRFSAAEMARRGAAVEAALAAADCDHLVFYGANRAGSAVQWLTQWPVTVEAIGVFTPRERDALFVQWINHAPLARRIAAEADVAWGGESSILAVIKALERRGARENRVGVIGAMNFAQHAALAARFGTIVDLNRTYVRLRRVKSQEEIDWLRIGAWLSDRGMAGLRDGLAVGLDERALGDLIERAYMREGGTNVIHFIGATSMHDPQLGVPAQFPSTRRVAKGDIVFAEISAAFWDHSGQVLRSFAVGEEPPPLYRALHAAADAAFDAVAAVLKPGATPAQVIEAS